MGNFRDGTCYTCRFAELSNNKIKCLEVSHPDKNDNINFTEDNIDVFNNKFVKWIRLFNKSFTTEYALDKGSLTAKTASNGARRLIKEILNEYKLDKEYKKIISNIEKAEDVTKALMPEELISKAIDIPLLKQQIMKDIEDNLKEYKSKFQSIVDNLNTQATNRKLEISNVIADVAPSFIAPATHKAVTEFMNTEGADVLEHVINKLTAKKVLEKLDESIASGIEEKAVERVNDVLTEYAEKHNSMIDNATDIINKLENLKVENNSRNDDSTSAETTRKLIDRIEKLTKQVNKVDNRNRDLQNIIEDRDNISKLYERIKILEDSIKAANKTISELKTKLKEASKVFV